MPADLATPQNFTVEADSATTATLTWQDVQGETGYEVYRWTSQSGTVKIADRAAGSTSYQATGLTPEGREWFYVSAISGNQSARTDWQLQVMPSQDAVPTVPGNLTLTTLSSDSARLQWDDSNDESTYEIYRWTSATGTIKIATLAANTMTYDASNLVPGGREWFYVKAVNGSKSARTEWKLLVMPTF